MQKIVAKGQAEMKGKNEERTGEQNLRKDK